MMRLALFFAILCCVTCVDAVPSRISAPSRAAMSSLPSDTDVLAFITYDDPSCINGLRILMRFDNVAIVSLPIHDIERIASRPGVRQISFDNVLRTSTDSSRVATHTYEVLNGAGLESAYDGSDVLLGIIDTGVDFNHLAFRDSVGHRRIECVYLPTVHSGHPVVVDGDTLPGSQFIGENEIVQLTTDDPTMTHGTHTLGIAGGSSVGPYGGMASGARLIVVAIPNDSLSSALILMGAKFIANYAKRNDLPCVINISMGDHLGPHDGTSPISRGLDAIANSGVIIVQSAGNEGNKALHLHKDFDPTNSLSGTRVGTVMRTSSGTASAEVDAWGADGTPFGLELQLYDTREGDARFTIPSIIGDTIIELDNDSVMRQYASGTIRVYAGIDEVNGRFRIYSVFDTKMFNNRDFWAHVYHCDTVASIDVWNVDTRSQFSQMGRYDWINGDGYYSINDMATGHKTISVASYSARDYYQTSNGATVSSGTKCGSIAASSSYGLLPDGRKLPLVAAPGIAVISSVSSHANSSSNWCYETIASDGRTYRWSNMSGTSMASPCVAGIVALWLQACPSLSPCDVQNIIAKTSMTDSFVESNPIRWGAGKINALEGIKMALTMRHDGLVGDVDDNGVVDVSDINIIINFILGQYPDDKSLKSRCDLNGDGVIDVSDLNIVINIILQNQ